MSFRLEAHFSRGDPFTQSTFETLTHNGTHVDAPYHFNPEGLTVAELPPESWWFSSPLLLELDAGDDELIGGRRLEAHAQRLGGADALLLRTGHGRYRQTDPARYTERNPGFEPSFAEAVFALAPQLRALFCDLPSCAAARALEPGIEFHQRVLGRRRRDRFLLLFEDVDLSADFARLEELWALPLRLEGLDGSPVTIVARIGAPT